jgi:hypothetical protein
MTDRPRRGASPADIWPEHGSQELCIAERCGFDSRQLQLHFFHRSSARNAPGSIFGGSKLALTLFYAWKFLRGLVNLWDRKDKGL